MSVSLNIKLMNNSHTLSYKILKTLIFHMLKYLEKNIHRKYVVKADQNQTKKIKCAFRKINLYLLFQSGLTW